MKIFVCVKHVPDTAAKITVIEDRSFAETCKFIVNPYDEYAVEEAVQLIQQAGGGEVIIVTVGKEAALNTMRAALALGADRGILVKTDAQFLDSGLTSQALQKAIEQDGAADLIFCGRQSIDTEGMQTPFRLAKALDMAVVSDVVGLSVSEGKAVAEREIGGGARQVVEMQLPCVIGATRGLNEPRYPKLPDIMKAKKKEIRQIDIGDLGLDLASPLTEIMNLEAVPERGQARMMQGSTREMVEELVKILKEEDKVI
ncbi:MAG: electron transfer flavoprotein subunit beta/FixA family protein [Desulfobacteraceae bacterium]|jgi:electron transfer flavoprotein beta subunit|nr:electron transfer flavoprotein subunit beta/FixA family protein [Desulfobacteraceae bacterium]